MIEWELAKVDVGSSLALPTLFYLLFGFPSSVFIPDTPLSKYNSNE